MIEKTKCPKCGNSECEVLNDEVDIGVGIQKHLLGFDCPTCGQIAACNECGFPDCLPHHCLCSQFKTEKSMNTIKLTDDRNETAKVIHQANIKWWRSIDTGAPIERNRYELLALVVSEISECLEGERKNLMDDKLPHRRMAEVEQADAWIRLMDYAAGFGFPIHPRRLTEIPAANKGEALFNITESVIMIRDLLIPSGRRVGDTLDMIEDYCALHGYDLEGAINEKMQYNAVREDHTHEARRIAGGKQF